MAGECGYGQCAECTFTLECFSTLPMACAQLQLRTLLGHYLGATGIAFVCRSGILALPKMVLAFLFSAFWYGRQSGGDNRTNVVFDPEKTWDQFRQERKLSMLDARVETLIKVCIWHLHQPIIFFVTFFAYSPTMNEAQWGLTMCAAIREAGYAWNILRICAEAPVAFLFTPSSANWKIKILYLFSPEKFLQSLLERKMQGWYYHNKGWVVRSHCYFCLPLEVSAVVAIFFSSQPLPIPLLICYVTVACGSLGLAVEVREDYDAYTMLQPYS